ncbi:ATP-binding protein [Streptomyces albidochromogenes]|uniref:ATP-binding protein n=1 Tax=Streptomyces albidochromogenes TaxID=329524 RepID=UPI001FCA68FE|nr:ATP-binding protein [Streptomyces albidochromogenes]
MVTGESGSGRSRLLSGFLMLCDPQFRKRLPLESLDPSIVPPELPAPAVTNTPGLTAVQILWLLADYFDLGASSTGDVLTKLAAVEHTAVVVPDVDRAGPVRTDRERSRLVRDVLNPLAATQTVRLLTDVPRELAADVVEGLPAGAAQIIDLDDPQWADPEGLVRHAEAALNPQSGAPELPFTVDPAQRRRLAEAIGRRAGTNHLVVQLAVHSILTAPDTFDSTDDLYLPASVGQALDLHSRRLGSDPHTLRLMLSPLALAEGAGIPVELWRRLVVAVAGPELAEAIGSGITLVAPFVEPVEDEDRRTLLRLLHPAIGDEIRAGMGDVPAAQSRIAVALLEAVPDQDWSRADPYVRDYIAGHTLEAGLLPQLLTDPGLFVHADPVRLRAAIEAAPIEALGAAALTYLRIAPLLTRTQAPAQLRAALLETAFVEDGLPEYAAAVHRLGIDLPWQTLWSLPVPGIHAVTVGRIPASGDNPAIPVAALAVPEGTPDAYPIGAQGGSSLLIRGLVQRAPLGDTSPERILPPSEEERASSPLALSVGGDYLRVWNRADETVVAALVSDVPLTGADLSPDGILLVATERGAKALRILTPTTPIAS